MRSGVFPAMGWSCQGPESVPGEETALDEAGLFPAEAPQEKSLTAELKRDTKAGLRLWRTRGERRGVGWLCGEGKERFQKYLKAQPLHSLPAGVCLASPEKPVAAG